MTMLARLFPAPWTLWAILSLPALPMIAGLSGGDPKVVHQLLHPTGEFAARFMIIAMIATPLSMLLRGWRGPRWLVRNRRYFGVAAFGYALAHTVLYLFDVGLSGAIGELGMTAIWTGWVAFLVFVVRRD